MAKSFAQQMAEDEARFQALHKGGVDPLDRSLERAKALLDPHFSGSLASQGMDLPGEAGRKQSNAAVAQAAETLRPGGVAQRYGEPVYNSARDYGLPMAAVALGGLPGVAANTLLSAKGIHDAVEDPSAMNIGSAALGAVPALAGARTLAKGGEVASVAQSLGRGVKGAASKVRQWLAPNEAEVVGGVRSKLKDVYGAGDMGATRQPANSVNARPPSMSNEPLPKPFDMKDFWSQYEKPTSPAPTIHEAFTEGQKTPASLAALDAEIGSQGATPPLAQAERAGAARPAGDFVHGADKSGGQFGFPHLPKISESELARLQAVFSRLGH